MQHELHGSNVATTDAHALAHNERLPGWLDTRFLERLVATPRGRAHVLGFLAAIEVDESAVFDTLLAKVQDPGLARLVRRHKEDEERHHRLLAECVARTGVEPGALPEELNVTLRLDRALGGFAESFVAGQLGVMETYVLLQVIEERAVRQYPHIVKALAPVDPESAEVLARVVEDEKRHVRYARAVSRRYAPDAETLEKTLAHVRAIERSVFEAHLAATMSHALENRLLAIGPAERLVWRALAAVQARRAAGPIGLAA
jgi:rubrerythrin